MTQKLLNVNLLFKILFVDNSNYWHSSTKIFNKIGTNTPEFSSLLSGVNEVIAILEC